MDLLKQLRPFFDASVRSRGEKYDRDNRVELDSVEAGIIRANVEGSSSRYYSVDMRWDDGDPLFLRANCNCPHYFKGEFCKHLWATLQIFSDGLWGLEDADRQVILQHEMDFDDVDDPPLSAGRAAPRPHQAPGFSTEPGRERVRPAGSWADFLHQASTDPVIEPADGSVRKLCLLIDLDRSRRIGNLVVDFYYRQHKRDGSLGKLRREGVARPDFARYRDPEDRRLLALLIGNEQPTERHYYSGPWGSRQDQRRLTSRIAPEMYDFLLGQMCAAGRLAWSDGPVVDAKAPTPESLQTVSWDAEHTWALRLKLTADPSVDGWRMSGLLVREGETVDLAQVVMVLADGLLLFRNQLARLAHPEDAHWVENLRHRAAPHIPFGEAEDFITHWWTLGYRPPTDLPEALQLESHSVPPQGYIGLSRDNTAYYSGAGRERTAAIRFVYNGYEVSPSSPNSGVVDLHMRHYIARDRTREQELLDTISRQGVKFQRGYYGAGDRYSVSDRRIVALVDHLLESDWRVEIDGVTQRRSTSMELAIESGIDWFDLEAEVDFDGERIAMPALLAARAAGETQVLLSDGSVGLLPEAWLDQYDRLAALGQSDGERVRLRNTQATLIEALVNGADGAVLHADDKFNSWRERLVHVDGIAASPPPPGFVGELRPYQAVGLGWLRFLDELDVGGCLADDMGLGKTVQMIALLLWRKHLNAANGEAPLPSVVVVPRSLTWNWHAEINRFAPNLEVMEYAGSDRKHQFAGIASVDVVLMTYGTLRRDIEMLREQPFQYAILDEAQAIKNARSQSAKSARLLQARQRFVMTGTPVENHIGELWSLFDFLNPGLLGTTTGFKSMAKAGGRNSLEAARLLSTGLRPFILRRTKSEVLADLPEKTEQTLFCELPAEQRELYDELRDYYRASLDTHIREVGLAKSKIHVLEALLRLRQVACHPGLVESSRREGSSAKLDVLMERLADVVAEGHKALVFSQFTQLLALVRRQVEQAGFSYEYLDGRTVNRQAVVNRFQTDPECDLFLISLKAGGHGLNLTAADYVFILDPWWNPAVEAQAIDRSHRMGQTRSVFAYRLIARDTVEEKIMALQDHKRALADAVVAADESLIRRLSADDLAILLG